MCSISREPIRKSECAFKQLQMFRLPDCYVQNKQHFLLLLKRFSCFIHKAYLYSDIGLLSAELFWRRTYGCFHISVILCASTSAPCCPLENQHPPRLSGETGRCCFCRIHVVKTLRSDKDQKANMTKRHHECSCARSLVPLESESGFSKRLVF